MFVIHVGFRRVSIGPHSNRPKVVCWTSLSIRLSRLPATACAESGNQRQGQRVGERYGMHTLTISNLTKKPVLQNHLISGVYRIVGCKAARPATHLCPRGEALCCAYRLICVSSTVTRPIPFFCFSLCLFRPGKDTIKSDPTLSISQNRVNYP